jgi:hypothetical protein
MAVLADANSTKDAKLHLLQEGARAHNVELAVGGPQIQAYPVSPEGSVRNETRLNLVILARFRQS